MGVQEVNYAAIYTYFSVPEFKEHTQLLSWSHIIIIIILLLLLLLLGARGSVVG
jgi:hypothetical protein